MVERTAVNRLVPGSSPGRGVPHSVSTSFFNISEDEVSFTISILIKPISSSFALFSLISKYISFEKVDNMKSGCKYFQILYFGNCI